MFYTNDNISTDTILDPIKFMQFNNDNIDPLDSFFLLNISKLPFYGSYIVQTETCRPELISYKLYNSTEYWWIIMLYNNILSLNEIKPGLKINYPSLTAINYLYEQAYLNKKAV